MIRDDCPTRQRGQTNLSPDKSLLGLDQVQGAFAEYTVLKAENVASLAESVSDELACLIEPLACAVHLLALAQAPLFARAMLFGMGPLGAMALIVANRLGYRVEVAEPSAGRRQMALDLGAVAVHDPLAADWRESVGLVPLSIDCTGVSPARHDAVKLTEPGGTVLLLGTTAVETTIDFRDVVRRELRLQASYGFTPRDFAASKALIEAGAVPVERWVQSRPLEEGQAAFESLVKPLDETLKVVLKPR
jgi:L-iditol 2-dehydrogenase